jgi:hypothetical protein
MSKSWILLAALAVAGTASPQLAVQAQNQNNRNQARQEVSLFNVTSERGNWTEVSNITLGGRSFPRALVASSFNRNVASVTIPVARRYERFRAWVGTRSNANSNDRNTFRVIGDGKVLFTSNSLGENSQPQRIDLDVSDISSLRLEVERRGHGSNSGAFASPVFVDVNRDRPNRPNRPTRPTNGRNQMIVRALSGGGYDVSINGESIDFGSVAPQASQGRVLVPMRRIFEELGATVNYDAATQRILATRANRRVELELGSTEAFVNNQRVRLDVPAQATFGTTLVPLRFISEAFDVSVDFQSSNY